MIEKAKPFLIALAVVVILQKLDYLPSGAKKLPLVG